MTTKTFNLFAAAASALVIAAARSTGAQAASAEEPRHEHWSFTGPFGSYDKEALQRGFQVYETVCSSCHGLSLVSFRNLGQKGGPFYLEECPAGVPATTDCSNPNENPIVKAIAANYKYQATDGPDDMGDMFERAPIPSDRIAGPYANENQARAANGGALPPDLSLITKARHHGPDYVFSLLTGFEEAPANFNVAPTQHYNPYFTGDMTQLLKDDFRDAEGRPMKGIEIPKGGVLAMAPPLADGIIDYADEHTPETVEQYAKDVTEFLAWAAEPKLDARKKLGFMAIAYLLVLTGLLYWSYREIWSKVDH
jgi:ubiquinol-cytochrome c reductase cytochrome c1 subunit